MQTAITVTGLGKSYGSLRAVDHLDISVARGEVFGLLGANGSGKSTTIECILGTKQADSGSISILGHRVHRHCAQILSVGVKLIRLIQKRKKY